MSFIVFVSTFTSHRKATMPRFIWIVYFENHCSVSNVPLVYTSVNSVNDVNNEVLFSVVCSLTFNDDINVVLSFNVVYPEKFNDDINILFLFNSGKPESLNHDNNAVCNMILWCENQNYSMKILAFPLAFKDELINVLITSFVFCIISLAFKLNTLSLL